MQTPAIRLFARLALFAATTLVAACGGDGVSSDPPPPAKAACGGSAVATARMSCPPGFVPPAS